MERHIGTWHMAEEENALSQLFQMPIDVIVRGNRRAIVPGSMARMQRAKIIDFSCFS